MHLATLAAESIVGVQAVGGCGVYRGPVPGMARIEAVDLDCMKGQLHPLWVEALWAVGCDRSVSVEHGVVLRPAGQDAAEAFYRVVDAAYERRSVAVTSNLHPSGFDTIMLKGLAAAIVDRLLLHAHLVATKGSSLRLADAMAGKVVVPLT